MPSYGWKPGIHSVKTCARCVKPFSLVKYPLIVSASSPINGCVVRAIYGRNPKIGANKDTFVFFFFYLCKYLILK